jgi:hypothetical protein
LLIALIEPQSHAKPFCPLTCPPALIEAHPHAKQVSRLSRPRDAIFALSQPPSRASVPTHNTNSHYAADGSQDQQSHEYGPVGLQCSSDYPPIQGGLGGRYSRPSAQVGVRTHLKSAVSIGRPRPLHRAVAARQRNNEDDQSRKIFALRCVQALSRTQISKLLTKYAASDERRC